MNPRERFWRTVRFQEVDCLPLWADWLGPWKRWREEGLPLPANLDDDKDDNRLKAWSLDYFGFEGMYSIFWGQPRTPPSTHSGMSASMFPSQSTHDSPTP